MARSFSIHCQDRQPGELRAAVDSFPVLVEGCSDIFHCGFASESSFGSTSYLLVRKGGNVLLDSPRFDARLLSNIKVLPVPVGGLCDNACRSAAAALCCKCPSSILHVCCKS